jgi:MFS family permease
LGLALIQGIGVFLAMTVGNLFIVEAHPKAEWGERIGWLQTFNSGGQVSGMLLAAALSQIDLSSSLLIAASLLSFAVLPGCLTPRLSPQTIDYRPADSWPDRHFQRDQESFHLQFSHSKLDIFRHLNSVRHTPFEQIMGVWFACVVGASAIYTLYPVMMQEVYGAGQNLIALSFAVAMGLSVFLYAQAGHWAHRFGPARILKSSMGIRLTAFMGIFFLEVFTFSRTVQLILLTFVLVVLCWPFIIVSATALTASLSPFGEGEAMGIFCAVLATACIVGAALGGWLAENWGYHAATAMAVSAECLGLILLYKIKCI